MHETLHILAFSQPLIDHFPQNFIAKSNDFYSISHGKLLSFYSKHIKCESLENLPIEDQTQNGFHLEKALFGNELMTANISSRSVLSQFGLLFLEDTGWYRARLESAEQFLWGKDKGCDFIHNSAQCSAQFDSHVQPNCDSSASGSNCEYEVTLDFESFKEFGLSEHSSSCDLSHTNKSVSIQDRFTGNCFRNESDPANSCLQSDHSFHKELEFESYSVSSRCFESTVEQRQTALCLKVQCGSESSENQSYMIGKSNLAKSYFFQNNSKEIEDSFLECHSEKEFVEWKGHRIQCADRDLVCPSSASCSSSCLLNGKCLLDGTCLCNFGFSGAQCEVKSSCSYYFCENPLPNSMTRFIAFVNMLACLVFVRSLW